MRPNGSIATGGGHARRSIVRPIWFFLETAPPSRAALQWQARRIARAGFGIIRRSLNAGIQRGELVAAHSRLRRPDGEADDAGDQPLWAHTETESDSVAARALEGNLRSIRRRFLAVHALPPEADGDRIDTSTLFAARCFRRWRRPALQMPSMLYGRHRFRKSKARVFRAQSACTPVKLLGSVSNLGERRLLAESLRCRRSSRTPDGLSSRLCAGGTVALLCRARPISFGDDEAAVELFLPTRTWLSPRLQSRRCR